jgi:glycosyltransferase involved in cell wall biosynthesis
MRILHVITGLNTGGAESMLFKLLTATQNFYAAQQVISMTHLGPIGKRMREQGFQVDSLEIPRGGITAGGVRRFVRSLSAFKPTIVVSWMYHANVFALLARMRSAPPPVVWNIRHSLHDIKSEHLLTRAMVRAGAVASRLPARIVYNSNRSLQQHSAIGYCGVAASVIPNGFDGQRFKPDGTRESRWWSELRLDGTAPVIGLIARFHPTKNHAMFLDVAARVAAQFPKLVVVMAGTGVDATNPVLMEAIRSRGLGERTKLLGEVADTAEVLNLLDIVCLTSGGESFPNVLGEALLCGKPCVATDVGDAPLIVGEGGAVVPVARPDLFADAVCRLLGMPKSQRENLGNVARERIVRCYGLEAVAKQYDQLYASVTGHSITF